MKSRRPCSPSDPPTVYPCPFNVQGPYRGIDAIKSAFEETWRKLHNEVYWLEDVDWIAVSDTVASCIYRFRWKADIDGKTYEGEGRGSTILRKEETQWKIVHEHLSRFPK